MKPIRLTLNYQAAAALRAAINPRLADLQVRLPILQAALSNQEGRSVSKRGILHLTILDVQDQITHLQTILTRL